MVVSILRADGTPVSAIREVEGLDHVPALTPEIIEIVAARTGTFGSVFYARETARRVEREISDQITLARGQRRDALRQGSMVNVSLADRRLAACALEAERLELLAARLDEAEATARAREAERRERVVVQAKVAERAVAEFRRALLAYERHAREITRIVELEARAQAEVTKLRQVGGTELPSLDGTTVLIHGVAHVLSEVVALPAAPGQSGMLCGKPHSKSVIYCESPYAAVADAAYGRSC